LLILAFSILLLTLALIQSNQNQIKNATIQFITDKVSVVLSKENWPTRDTSGFKIEVVLFLFENKNQRNFY